MQADMIERLRAYAKRLDRLGKKFRDASHNQEDCCHGSGAAEALEDSADTVESIALDMDRWTIDLEREAARVGG